MQPKVTASDRAEDDCLVVRDAFSRPEVEPGNAWDRVTRGPTTRDYRNVILVSGEDPHACKGVEDIDRADLRTGSPKPADLAEAAEHAEWSAG